MGGAVRPASHEDSLDVLSAHGVIDRLMVTPKEVIQGTPYMINNRMLLVLIEHSKESVEAHIGEPKEYWSHIHDDIEESLIFIRSLGYNRVYTNVRKSLKTTLNLLKKHEFKQVDMIQDEVILEWESKQHF
jgi:hypothetical protein